MGNVWKLIFILKLWRPDLKRDLTNTSPSGLMLVSNLDNINQSLESNFKSILASALKWEFPPVDVISRIGAISPSEFLESFKLQF
jgi:hypothetical protein